MNNYKLQGAPWGNYKDPGGPWGPWCSPNYFKKRLKTGPVPVPVPVLRV
jgi:hypothetical protein